MKNLRFSIYPWFQFLLVLLVSLTGVVVLQLPRANQDNTDLTKEQALQAEQQRKLRLDLLKQIPNFGYQNLLADWIFLDFVQYYGDGAARALTGNALSGDYFEAVVSKDPRFIESYFILAPATSLFTGNPLKSVELMEQGLEFLTPETDLAYQIWMYKAIDETLFLGDNQKARQSYLTAADWAQYHDTEAARLTQQRAEETARFLATNPDSRLVQASAWVMVYSNARDDQTRKLALEKIKETGAEVIITPNRISVRMPQEN